MDKHCMHMFVFTRQLLQRSDEEEIELYIA